MKPKCTIPIVFQPGDQIVQASQQQTWLEAALVANLEISHSCGGNGTCGTCRVLVLSGLEQLAERNEIEAEMASERNFASEERLCCQNLAMPGLVLKIPEA